MSSKNKLIINCGTSQVSVAEFSVSGGRLVLENFKVQELKYDFTSQAEWLAELSTSLKLMGVKGPATLIAPAHLLLTKTIKVPHVEGGRQDEVIRFEAEKNIPYDLKDVTWDYQVISDDGVEKEILLISMKASAADEFCAAVQTAGIIPKCIEASSILEYNTWKYCGLESDVLLLNVGARFSNIIIAREGGLFARSIPVGGNALTQVIGDSIGQNFNNSEELKIRFFSNSDAMNSNSAGVEHFTSAASNVMKRIGLELKRSIVNYRRTGRVENPSKIYLSGRGSLLPGFAEFLAEDQKMSVEYLDALSNVSVGPQVNQGLLNDSASIVGELVGEAARMVLPEAKGVNLLPTHIVEDAAFAKKRPLVILSAVILAAAVIPPALFQTQLIKEEKSYASDFEASVSPLVERFEQLKENEATVKSLTTKISGLEGLAESKSNWINLFIDIEKRLMEQKDVWLDNLQVLRTADAGKNEYKLALSGRLLLRDFNPDDPNAYDPVKAVERIQKLLTSFTDSTFIKSFENITTDPSNPRILKFDFTLVVNPDKPI